MSKQAWRSMFKQLCILLTGACWAPAVGLLGCVSRTPGIEVSVMVMPLDAALVAENAELGMGALAITGLEFIPCALEAHSSGTHSHQTITAMAVQDVPLMVVWRMAPGSYCEVRVTLALGEAAPREVVLRAGCADGRLPIALDHARRRAAFVMNFPDALRVERVAETEIDRQRVLDALMRGVAVERVDCETIQP